MLDLNQMSVFIRVVQEGSFTGAARALGIPKSRVSRMITDLEDKLAVRMLERTTREVRPTDIGLQYYQQYKPLFEEITDIHARISDHQDEPTGHLRVCAPVSFAIDVMGRWTTEFKDLYPKIELELEFNDSEINLIRDGFDVGFVMGQMEDSSLIARKFDDTDPILCASPAFVEKYGPFTHPSQLNTVPWISVSPNNKRVHNVLLTHTQSDEHIDVKPNIAVKVNHNEVAIHHMVAGQGVAVSGGFFTYERILKGELEVILPHWKIKQEPLYMVFPSGRHQAKKVRAFIDFFISKSEFLHNLMDQLPNLSEQEKLEILNKAINKS
jgi:LysR family transcriptional regulator for bpeEF and oprC